jgi:hypothetical protein
MDFVLHTHPHTLHARTLIAFYPSEGFAILEGYTRSVPKDSPIVGNLFIGKSYYMIEITHIARKDLQDDPSARVDCTCTEECDCNIVFFPTYLVILEFKVLKQSDDGTNYCIDDRFATPQDLLARYKSLLELPENSSFTNDPREEDAEFYAEYYRLLKKDENIHGL